MASSSDRAFSGTDLQFLLTLAAGMIGFWLSGHLPAYLPLEQLPRGPVAIIAGLVIALLIYGLGMALWASVVLGRRRTVKAIVAAGVVTAVLALATTLTLTKLQASWSLSQSQVAMLIFALYLLYGLYYVIGWAVARRLAPKSA